MSKLFFSLGVLSKRASNPLQPVRPGPPGPAPVPSLETQRRHNTVFAPFTKALYGTPESSLAQSKNLKSPPSKLPRAAPGIPAIDEFRLPGPRNPDPLVGNWEHRFSIPLTQAEHMRNLARAQATVPRQRRELLVDAAQQGGFTKLPQEPPYARIPELTKLQAVKDNKQLLASGVLDNEQHKLLGWDGAGFLGPAKVPLPEHQQRLTNRDFGAWRQSLRALQEGRP